MSAPNQVDLFFTYVVKEGMQERFEEYRSTLYPVTEHEEPWVLEYELFRNADGGYLQHERYFDEAAIHRHLEVTAEAQAMFGEATELQQILVAGPVSDRFWSLFGGPAVTGYERVQQVQR